MHSTMPRPGRDVINVLESFGEIEWGSGGIVIRDDSDWRYPPVVMWRYKNEDERRDQLIVDAVNTFNGSIQWASYFRDRKRLSGRNWSIVPKRLKEFLEEIKDNPSIIEAAGALDAEGAFAATEPEVGKAANREIPQLAEHIKKFVQEGLNSSIRSQTTST
jgi:hypothetical protein